MSPPKALRLAFARACEDLAKFESAITGFEEIKLNLVQVVDALATSDLILAIQGPGGAAGLAIWDCQAIAAFIEQFITGSVVKSVAEDRVATQADAAVLGSILNQFLTDFDAELGPIADAPPVRGFQKSGMFEDGREIVMTMADVEYRQYRLVLDLDDGAKVGGLRLIFPWQSGAGIAVREGGDIWDGAWRSSLADATAPVLAILHRLALPLSQIMQFGVGTVVPIPAAAIANVSLEGNDQKPVAAGRLGQSNGHRAVRLIGGGDVGQGAVAQPAFENAQTPPDTPALAPVGVEPEQSVAPVAPVDAAQPAPMAMPMINVDELAVS